MSLFGFLNINKPAGVTSRWVVNRVVPLVRPAKVGHAGTLDPLATGVLVVALGPATRLVEYVQQLPKKYAAEFLLGRSSPTEDIDGDVAELVDSPVPSRDQIEQAAVALTGTIMQRPPAFSALKLQGRRAYDMARAGQHVELAPRPITVYSMTVAAYEYPRLALEIECSSGTYVRSLGRDLAIACGTQAVMSQLTRTAIGHFTLDEAVSVESLDRDCLAQHLIAAAVGLRHLPRAVITAEDVRQLAHGRAISANLPPDTEVAAAVDADENLCALLQPREGLWHPFRSFVLSAGE